MVTVATVSFKINERKVRNRKTVLNSPEVIMRGMKRFIVSVHQKNWLQTGKL